MGWNVKLDKALLTEFAGEIADEVVEWWSEKHPLFRCNAAEWSDLKEMIRREVYGHFREPGSPNVGAKDLVSGG